MANETQTLLETRRFSVLEYRVTRPDGSIATCQVVEHPGSVAILPVTTDGRLCLIRSRRLTVGKTLVEVPAGTREPDEPPLDTAHRELKEETGYRAGKLEKLGEFYTSPGVLSERMHLFLATELTPGAPQREANEEIDNLLVSWDEALAMVDGGQIEDGKTLVALLVFDRRQRIQKEQKE